MMLATAVFRKFTHSNHTIWVISNLVAAIQVVAVALLLVGCDV